MKCPYCDTEYEPEILRSYDEDLQNVGGEDIRWESKKREWTSGETDGMDVYICKSCGGEIIAESTEGTSKCPFCNNIVILKSRFAGELKPDYIIPFKLDKRTAKEGFKKHLLGKKLLPKTFKDETRINGIKGVYVPFWLFDADAKADARYRATRLFSWSDSNFIYTRTSFYSVTRSGEMHFEKIPVDGSSRMADDLMESIEPFDFSQAVDFQTAYLSGFFANKYDVDAEMSISRANDRLRDSASRELSGTVNGYATVTPEVMSIRAENGASHYALYPVWVMTTTWKNKNYIFAMNGQTGKFVGDLPMDKKAFWLWFSGVFGAVSASVLGLLSLIWLI